MKCLCPTEEEVLLLKVYASKYIKQADGRRLYRPKGGAIMDIDIVWDDEELEELEELNEIFNL